MVAFAELVSKNFQAFLNSSSITKEIQRQWKAFSQALLPLVILGHEEDPEMLWFMVQQFDSRTLARNLVEEEAACMLRLEAALDACSSWIIDQADAQVRALCPAAQLARGIIDGFWCIYALLPRDSWRPPEKPAQIALF